MTINKFFEDGTTAGLTSLSTGAILETIPAPNGPDEWQTIYIPLITGLVAPLIKELILYLREKRKASKEKQNKKIDYVQSEKR